MSDLQLSLFTSKSEKLSGSLETAAAPNEAVNDLQQLNLTAPEWLAVFPAPTPNPDSFLAESPSDPAINAREADPLSRAAVLKEADKYPLLGTLVRLNLELGAKLTRFLYPLVVLDYVATTVTPLIGCVWAFQGELASTRELTAALVALCVAVLTNAVLGFVLDALRVSRVTNWMFKFKNQDLSLDRHALAGVVRWSQLVERDKEAEEMGREKSLLLRHVEGDYGCPCPDYHCSGRMVKMVGPMMFFGIIVRLVVQIAALPLSCWTTLVFFGARAWTTWYSALAGCLTRKLGIWI